MLFDGLDEVVAAAWIKTAHFGKQRADDQLVEIHRHEDQEGKHPARQGCNLADHGPRFPHASLRASSAADATSVSFSSSSLGSRSDRGMITRSSPLGKRQRTRRKASR